MKLKENKWYWVKDSNGKLLPMQYDSSLMFYSKSNKCEILEPHIPSGVLKHYHIISKISKPKKSKINCNKKENK